jgi:hypothetical protein
VIPSNARYYVAASPAQAAGARPVTFYWLFPRRYVDAPSEASWIVAFGIPARAVGVPVGRIVELGRGVVAARVVP